MMLLFCGVISCYYIDIDFDLNLTSRYIATYVFFT